jgi:dihydroneopterin aldolase/2-amino-4-hydroxy-6-hydroxymethyldihydropteridine diphosphokinase
VARVFIGVGSNIDPEQNVLRALQMLGREARIVAISTFYRTEPEKRPEQPQFVNGVVEIHTDVPPEVLKRDVLRRIEHDLGRRRSEDAYAARTIDLDILVYDDIVSETDDMRIPDPDIADRPFLAIPLYELAPQLILPGSGMRVRDLGARFEDHTMQALAEFTQALKRSIENGP